MVRVSVGVGVRGVVPAGTGPIDRWFELQYVVSCPCLGGVVYSQLRGVGSYRQSLEISEPATTR